MQTGQSHLASSPVESVLGNRREPERRVRTWKRARYVGSEPRKHVYPIDINHLRENPLGRTLRSGKIFSPWNPDPERTVCVANDFSLRTFLSENSLDNTAFEASDDEREPVLQDNPTTLVDGDGSASEHHPTTFLDEDTDDDRYVTPQHSRKRKGTNRTRRSNIRKRRKRNPMLESQRILQGHLSSALENTTPCNVSARNDLKASNMGWIGVSDAKLAIEPREYSLDEVIGPVAKENRIFMKLETWDGRQCVPLHDIDGRIIVVLGGHPGKPRQWKKVVSCVTKAIRQAAQKLEFADNQLVHRRGRYGTVSVGISFGGGQTVPGNLRNEENTSSVMEDLLSNEAVQRVSGFANSVFRHYSPKNFNACRENLATILDHYPDLKSNLPDSVYAGFTVNFGPRTVTFPHRDFRNWLRVWCAVTSFGSYDHEKGGHLILWDLGLVIQFPPGATILLPSALLLHSNVRIQGDENRYSITQFYAGGLFRWVYNDFKTDEAWLKTSTKAQRDRRENDISRRWEEAVESFQTVDQLRERVGSVAVA